MDSNGMIQWDQLRDLPFATKVNTLQVGSWEARDNQAVLSLLSTYEVKKVYFFARRLANRMILPLVAQPLHLETIMVEQSAFLKDQQAYPLLNSLRCLWVNTRVRKLIIVLLPNDVGKFNHVYEQLLASGIGRSFSLIDVCFQRDGTKLRSGKAKASVKVKNILTLNKVYLQKCRTIAIIFLTKRIIGRQIDPNVSKMIAHMIWATRGTDLWKRKAIQLK